MWEWIKKHPQRTSSFLLIVFTQVQGSLALYDLQLPPVVAWLVNSTIGCVMAVLAWNIKNLKDDGEPPGV